VIYLLLPLTLLAAAYQTVALLACLARLAVRRRPPPPPRAGGVSVIKPVRGLDPGFAEAIRSQVEQDHPEFEVLFGVHDPEDPAAVEIEALIRAHPERRIRLIHTRVQAPNAKVGVMIDLVREARFDTLVISDSDIKVERDYLTRVTAPLADARVGLVTCLYRATAESWPGHWEALGIATDFAPSTLVAPFFGVDEFAFGSTMAVRRADVERIGGLEVLGDFIADDYQLGKRIHALGLRCELSEVVVETSLDAASWAGVWRHQLRWARTIRVSRLGGYAGLPVTHATTWVVLAAACGYGWLAAPLFLLRMAMALTAGLGVLRSPVVARMVLLIPFRDLWGAAVWVAGWFGSTVLWRGRRLTLTSDGKIR
jgi:ceramide glucosyltransferase